MDPQQQYPSGQNPYDFILNPPKPPKPSVFAKLPGGNNPFAVKLGLILGGAVVLMIFLAIIANLLGSGNSANNAKLVEIAQEQTEIIRITNQGGTTATAQNVKNLAITTRLSLLTQQQQVLTLLGKRGVKVSAKQLKLKQDAQTDQKLTLAQQTSTYDSVFSNTVQTQLQAYANDLKSLFATSGSETERTLLSTQYTQAQLLISQVPSAESLQGD